MKQQELKDIKRTLLNMMKDISDKANDPSRPRDEEADLIIGAIHNVVCLVVNKIEAKYKK